MLAEWIHWVVGKLPRAFMLNHALFESGQSAEAKEGFDRYWGSNRLLRTAKYTGFYSATAGALPRMKDN